MYAYKNIVQNVYINNTGGNAKNNLFYIYKMTLNLFNVLIVILLSKKMMDVIILNVDVDINSVINVVEYGKDLLIYV